VFAKDAASDLALLRLEGVPPTGVSSLPWRRNVQLGERVGVFGYPHLGTLSSTGSFTQGDVTSLAGLGNNVVHFQLSAPVHPGNSGGPVMDDRGNIVGVVVSKLNALAVLEESGDMPQNVNFAIKSSHAASFLDAHGVSPVAGIEDAPILDGPDRAKLLRSASVLILCFQEGERTNATALR